MLALTSNKEGPEVQHAAHRRRRHRRRHASSTGCRALNAGAEPLGSFGAVVGATIGDTDEDLDINGPLLAPGYGAQGGTVADLRRIFGGPPRDVLPSSSRELLAAGPDPRASRRRPAHERRAGRAAVVTPRRTRWPRRRRARCCALLPLAGVRRRPAGGVLRGGQASTRRSSPRSSASGGQDSLRRPGHLPRPAQQGAADVSDEWQQVVTRIEALDRALRAAGVDPATYDRARPPPGLSGPSGRDIDAAARELGSRSTAGRPGGLDQQALDVCRTR